MIVGKANIICWFEELNVPYWALFYKGKTESGNPVKRSNQADNVVPADAIAELTKTLGYLDRGQYTIMAGEKANLAIRGNYRVDFEIPYQDTHSAGNFPALPAIAGIPQTVEEMESFADKRAQKMLEKFKLEQKIEALEMENRELKQDNKELEEKASSASNKIMNAISGIGLDKILGAFMNKPIPVISGIPHAQGPEENDQAAERIAKALEVFEKYDPDFVNTLEKMAAKIESNPSVIGTLKMML